MNHLDLFRLHGTTVAFGFLLAFLSSFGQTYFVALFVPDLRAALGLSQGGFGVIYSAGTLASGLLLIWAGAAIDRVSVRLFASISLLGLALAATLTSVAGGVILLFVAMFGLRLCGQGMLSHASVTSTARLPLGLRGRAIGYAGLGFQVGAAAFPFAGVMLIQHFGWVATWRIAALVALGFALAIFPWRRAARAAAPAPRTDAATPQRSRRDILRDPRFLLLIPNMIGPPAVSTGWFFHQRLIADDKGWSLDLLAAGVATTAMTSFLCSMLFGALTDRFGALRLMRIHLLPLAAASLTLAVMSGPASIFVFFALMGITSGASGVVVTAALAELYGVAQIGMIRAVAGAIMVLASATTPALLGAIFDAGVGLSVVGSAAAGYLVIASAVTLMVRGTGKN